VGFRKFPDIYAGVKGTSVGGVHTIGLDYKWDASRDQSKSFHFITFLDLSQSNQAKYKFLLTDPDRSFLISAEQKQERKSRDMEWRDGRKKNPSELFLLRRVN